MGGDPALRLVVAPQTRRVGCGQGAAVDQDAVGGGYVARGALQHLAVDGDAARLDPALGLAPRAQPGARQRLGDPHWAGGCARRTDSRASRAALLTWWA